MAHWNSLLGLSKNVHSSALYENILSMGFNKRLGLSRIQATPGDHNYTSVNLEYSKGRSHSSSSCSSNLYTDQVSSQTTRIDDYSLQHGYGQEVDKGLGNATRSSSSLADKPRQLARNWTYDTPRNVVDERSIGKTSGFPMTNPLSMRWQGRHGQVHPDFTEGNINCLQNSSSVNNYKKSRASSCKRKSCTSSLLTNSSLRTGLPHHSSLQEGHGGRFTRGCSTNNHISGIVDCVSTSDVDASTPATVIGRVSKTSLASNLVVDPGPRKSSKSSSGVVTSGASRSKGVNTTSIVKQIGHQTSIKTQPPLECVRRALSPLQSDTWCSKTISATDCLSNTNFPCKNGDMLMQSTGKLINSNKDQRRESQLVSTSKNGSTSCGRLDDHTTSSSFGERLSHNYLTTSNKNIITSDLLPINRIETYNRLQGQKHLNSSSELPSNFESVVDYSQSLANANGGLHSGIASRFALSGSPPLPPPTTRQNLSSTHLSMLSSPSCGPQMPSPPSGASCFSSTTEVIPSRSSVIQSSLLPRYAPSLNGHGEREFGSNVGSDVESPFYNFQLSQRDHQPRLVAEGLAEILLALDQVERDEDLSYEQLLMLEATLLFRGLGLHDQYSDLRLDVDNMSYEELLALEEKIGTVDARLTIDIVNKHLKKHRYSSQGVAIANSQESDSKCSVCQEEYEDGDELGEIKCGHSYHAACIRQWLLCKNLCPICKSSVVP